ncbi:MAG: glycosyltransferase family 4 protein [Bacteroidales bacterium]|nr:glycosyltransferase family 4 protein [Bacteroidales bacterium]
MRKIALITPMLQPYRLSFYEKLSRFHPDVKWVVYHGIKKAEDGRPAFRGQTTFDNAGVIESKYRIGPFDIRVHKGLFRAIVALDPDMIIIQSITGNLSYRKVVRWARRKNKVIVNWACAWEPGFAKGLVLKFKNMLVSSFYRKGDFTLTYSTKAIQYVKDRGIETSKIDVCYNGIEIDEMLINEKAVWASAEKIRQDFELNDSITFLYVGGLLSEKRVDLLINAFLKLRQEFPSIKLLIIGDGPERENIVNMIKESGGENVRYLGRIIDGVNPYFAASTCLVLPGVGGLALNQAMFWKKICIASEADGTEEDLVTDGITGFRFSKDDLESLTEAMRKTILLNTNEREKMGENAKNIILTKSNVNSMVEVFVRTIENFFPEIVVEKTE